MTYYPDLSPYEYSLPIKLASVQTVGWLALSKPFSTGAVDVGLIPSLEWCICNCSTNEMRGFHHCEFCSEEQLGIQCGNTQRRLGSAEIWIPAENGVIFAAPNLILHYIQKHKYLPPFEFLESVRRLYAQKTPITNLYDKIVDEAIRTGQGK